MKHWLTWRRPWRKNGQFRALAVTYQKGAPVRLQDVARGLADVQANRNPAWFDVRRSVTAGEALRTFAAVLFPCGRERAYMRSAHLQRLGEQFARVRVIVDDEQLKVPG